MALLSNPFTAPGRWLRGNLHAHTTNSDGAMPPEKLAAHYAHAGWDFLVITDHWHVSTIPEPFTLANAPTGIADITVLPGIEVNSGPGSTSARTNYHVVGIGVEDTIPRNTDLTGPAAAQWFIDAIREQGGEAVIAHPYWSGLTLHDLAEVRRYLAIEVFNTDTEMHIGRGRSETLWDDLLTNGFSTLALGVDDCHRPGQDSLRGWTVVRAADRTPAAIIAALRAGHFYASSGPEIYDVQVDLQGDGTTTPYTGTVSVRCSPVRSITLVANATRGARLNAGPFGMAQRARRLRPTGQKPEGTVEGDLLTGAELILTGLERYARIQVEDAAGRCAWTNPLFVHPPA
jgi:hypothetical protein